MLKSALFDYLPLKQAPEALKWTEKGFVQIEGQDMEDLPLSSENIQMILYSVFKSEKIPTAKKQELLEKK